MRKYSQDGESLADASDALESLLSVLRDIVEDYDDTGCDGCGVISEAVYDEAQRVLRGDA